LNRLATFLLRVILGIQIKSGIQEVIYDEDIDGVRLNQKHIFNLSGETYVNLFKRHKEEKEGR
jgi:hypothetical protein